MPNEKSPKKRDKPAARASPLTEQEEVSLRTPLSELHPFKGDPGLRDIRPRRPPYQVRDDDPIMQQIAATVKVRGVRDSRGLCGLTRRAGMKLSPDTGATGPASWLNWRTCP